MDPRLSALLRIAREWTASYRSGRWSGQMSAKPANLSWRVKVAR